MILKGSYINEEEKFLIDVLSSVYPDKDFEPGSTYNELIVKPMATMFASLKLYLVQSNMIANLLAYDTTSFNGDLEAAMKATLKNWLITPRKGSRATGFVRLYVLDNTEQIVVSNEARLSRDGTRYKINSEIPVTIPIVDLEPVIDDNGVIAGYRTPPIPIIAENTGRAGNAPNGALFTSWTVPMIPQSVYKIVADGDIIGGEDDEAAASITVSKIKDALSVRNLVSKRSIISAIISNFPDVIDVVPIGFKDPEMTRNRINLYNCYYRIGGCDDIYIFRPPMLKSKTGIVGEAIVSKVDGLPDNRYLTIKGVQYVQDIEKAYVKVNLPPTSEYIKKGFPTLYVIQRVLGYSAQEDSLTLEISPSCPEPYHFNPGEITIGIQYDSFDDMVSDKEATIDFFASTGSMIMLEYPVLDIRNVYIYNPQNSEADPSSGYVKLKRVVNQNPGLNEYKVVIPDKDKFNSYGNSVGILLDQDNIKRKYVVEYLTMEMGDIASYVLGEDNAVLAIDRLIKSKLMANVSLFIQCSMLAGNNLNIDLVKDRIVSLINNFDFKNNKLTCDSIKSILYNFGAESVLVVATYSVLAPTGRVVKFTSTSSISISDENIDKNLSEGDLTDLSGITNRIVQFYTSKDNINIEVI
ncbi:MAG: hypothetical protein ABIM30_00120 [candidate division WOR-3 bacterium]